MKQVIGHNARHFFMLGVFSMVSPLSFGQEEVIAAAEPAGATAESTAMRFDISGYTLEGATLLTQAEIAAAVTPYTGKSKDFADVQR
ncbi:MAG: POTRA domain-containing protein, partial [Gallionella sp.]|nr:POTRA domain-containing protein [Gallionella sp.]